MDEVTQLWLEIDRWHDENGATRETQGRKPGASSEALAALERTLGYALPADHRASLAIHDGGGHFESYEHLGTTAIIGTWKMWHELDRSGKLAARGMADPGEIETWWNDAWIPFAQDSCGNLFCLDTASTRILALETQDAQGVFPVAKLRTFTDFLRRYRDKLTSGALGVDEEGFVGEPIVKPAVPRPTDPAPALAPEVAARIEALIDAGDASALAKLIDDENIIVDHRLKFGRLPLALAAERGKRAIVELLLARGASVNAGEERGERTALFWAVWGMRTDPAIVAALLAAGANPNAMTAYDGTALHAAVMWESAANITALLAHGGDPSLRDAKGKTPLECATSPAQRAVRAVLEAHRHPS